MNDQRKTGGALAAIITVVALVLFCVLAGGLALGYAEYLANKQAARARSIEVPKQIEAREASQEAAHRAAELATEPTENP